MDTRRELLFGKLLIAENIIGKDRLKQYLELQETQGFLLPQILLKENLLDAHRLHPLVEKYLHLAHENALEESGEELVLSRLLLKNQLLTSHALSEVWKEKQASTAMSSLSLGELLLKKGLISAVKLLEIYNELEKETFGCPGCDKAFRLLRLSPGKKLRCKHCKTVFQVPTIEHEIGVYEAPSTSDDMVEGSDLLDEEVPREVADYEILAKIAQGGMGIVCRAQKKTTGQVVAMKILREAHRSSLEAKERFKREALTVKNKLAKHKNIVAVLDVGIEKDVPYFTMDFIEGKSLSETIGDKPLPVEQAVNILICLAEGIHYAHSKGVVHRDIKPSNILLDQEGKPLITDFGLAKCMDSMTFVTRSGSTLGTPYYMSPEQAQGKQGLVGPRSDIYALGVVLYEMLTGQNPFKGKDTIEIYQNILSLNPSPPSKLNPQVPKQLDNICLKCLRKKSFQRYSTAEELANDLRRFQQGKHKWWRSLW